MPTNVTVGNNGTSRRWKRYPFTVPIQVKIEKPEHAFLVDTHASDVNDGGIAMHANAELSVGMEAEIEFTPGDFDFPLSLKGVVRNRSGRQYGVEFVETSPVDKEHLILFQEILHAKVDR